MHLQRGAASDGFFGGRSLVSATSDELDRAVGQCSMKQVDSSDERYGSK
jgi:hypothetical protein